VILSAKPNQGRRDALQLFSRAFAGEHVATEGLEDLEGDG
jgi:hypothetical protein